MRLVKIGLAVGEHHGGRPHAQRRPRAALRAGDGGRRRHGGRLPGAADRRLPARGPDPVAGLRRGPVARSCERFARETAPLPTVLRPRRRRRSTRVCATTARRWSPAARSAAWCRRRSCPPTTSSTRAAPSPAAFPASASEHRGVPFGDFIFRFDFGVIAPEVCEDVWSADGPMRRRTYSGAELVVNISASPFRVGTDADPARAAHHPRRGPPVHLAYANAGRRQRRAHLRRRRLRQPERQADARGAALARGLRGDDGRPRPHHAPARARTPPGGWTTRRGRPAHAPVPTIDMPGEPVPHPPRDADLPGARARQLLPPRPGEAARRRATRYCEDMLDALALGVGDYFEKNARLQDDRHRALRRPRLAAHPAHRPPLRRRGRSPTTPGSLLRAFYMPTRYSSAETEKAARDHLPRARRPAPGGAHRRGVRARAEAATSRCSGRARRSPRSPSRTSRRGSAAQRMWNWSNSSAGSSCRPAT